jgi:hypothetical protein
LTIDFPVRLREQIGQVFGDRLAVGFRFSHGLRLCVDAGMNIQSLCPFCMHATR